MDTTNNYKNRALASLNGKWDKAAIATLICMLIMGIPYYIPFFFFSPENGIIGVFGLLVLLVMLPLTWGFVVYFMRIKRNESLEYTRLFDGFRDFERVFFTKLLVGVYTFLWSLLFLVPGIIKGYSYSMTDYVLKDNPELKYNQAIERSMKLMEGHKLELFWLHLTFIGWAILAMLTFGLGYLLLIPYIGTATAHFYEDLKAQEDMETNLYGNL